MKRYFVNESTAYSGTEWREVAVNESEIETREEFGCDQPYYKGQRLYEGDPEEDKYFYLRFTGQIHWLPLENNNQK